MGIDVQTMQIINGVKMEEKAGLGKKIGSGKLIQMVWTRDLHAAFVAETKKVNP